MTNKGRAECGTGKRVPFRHFGGGRLEAADEEFAFVDELGGEAVVEGDEELFVVHDLALPGVGIDVLELVEEFAQLVAGNVQALPVDVLEEGGPANGGLLAVGVAVDAVDDPLEDTHVFAVAGPEEVATGVLAEPVDLEDARSVAEVALHADPVAEVVAHVVSAEG